MSGASGPLWRRIRAAPGPAKAGLAKPLADDLLADMAACAAETAGAPAIAASGELRSLLTGIADQSPFLWRLMQADPARLLALCAAAPEDSADSIIAAMTQTVAAADDEADAMRALRRARQSAALLVALCDLGGLWPLESVTQTLTRFADAAVSSALAFLLRQADGGATPDASGLCVLALGKHGAGELNYSSDIDIVVFFDPEAPALASVSNVQRHCVRLVKGLVRLLQEPTQDGYVLRVDLRLRPDPGSTSVAIALPAALDYYESLGQNWERAAFIKARPVAGDMLLGERFLKNLTPFIWRRYFDYAAIADVHAMKRQIHAVRGHDEIAVAGHDIKLGRGGIREIEFFVQTQQLIYGGRRPQLRGPRTLDMLAQLNADGWITAGAVRELAEAYVFLRTIEHRLQMVHDEQTQRLPSDAAALEKFARFCGFATVAQFGKTLRARLACVERHYARLFEHAPGLDAKGGSLVFTGVADDPETLETLKGLGFRDAAKASGSIRGWHYGRRAGVQSARAREVLTALVPALLQAFSGSGEPDAALAAFDQALARMPAAVELFSILGSNEKLRTLFADMLGGAPRLAEIVVARPHVLDAAIDPAASQGSFSERAAQRFDADASLEDFLNRAGGFAQEQMFLIGLRLLSGAGTPMQAAQDYTALAETLIAAALRQIQSAFERDHGVVKGGRCAVLGFGKLGSFEMTATSDLDLVLVYDFDAAAPESNGARPLHATLYYTRLTHRLVAALTAPLRHGKLYDVDMRLRPSGGKGPVAVQFAGFVSYQRTEAEAWEHMALTRARAVAGDLSLREDLMRAVAAIVSAPRDSRALARQVLAMRALIAQEKGESDPFDLKLARGGLIDLEFLAQYFCLAYAHAFPALRGARTAQALAAAGEAGLLSAADAACLTRAHALLSAVTQIVRLTAGDRADPQALASGVKARIARIIGLPDFPRLGAELEETRGKVRKVFDRLLAG